MFINNKIKNNLVFSNYKNNILPLIEDTTQNKFIFTQQYKHGFKYCCFDTFENVEQYLKENNNLFEVLQYNKCIKPFIDIDINDKIFNKETILKNILTEYKKAFYNGFKINIDDKDIIILDSTRENKISYHIIINNGYYFQNIEQQGIFIKYLFNQANNIESNEIKYLIDKSVYYKNKNFRCVNQTKYNDKNNLIMVSNHNIKQSLIIDYFNECTINKKNIVDCSFIIKELLKLRDDTLINKLNLKYDHIYFNNNDKNDLKYILSQIPREYYENYNYWWRIGVAVKNINFDFYDLFDFYSKGCKKYDEAENYELYKKNNGSNGWCYLYSLPNKEGLNKHIEEKLINEYKKFDSVNISEDFKIIEDNNKYMNSNNLINAVEKHIILYSPMGSGKTHITNEYLKILKKDENKNNNNTTKTDTTTEDLKALKNLIDVKEKKLNLWKNEDEEIKEDEHFKKDYKKLQNKIYELRQKYNELKNNNNYTKDLKVLFITPRITCANHTFKTFNTILGDLQDYNEYKTKEQAAELYKYDGSIIISPESIYKLNKNNKYDLIFIDEVESNLNQLSSTTCKNKNDSFKNIYNFINNATRVIYAYAFITNRTINFIKKLDGEKLLIKNTHNDNKKKAYIYNDWEALTTKLLKDLKQGKKIYCHVTSCRFGQELVDKIINEKILKNEDVLYYSSNESIKNGNTLTNNEMLLDINNEWAKYKFIISTSSITVGNSYEREDIDDVYIFGGISYFGGCSVRDSFQNHMRVRKNQGDLWVYLPDEPKKKKYNFELLNFIENYEIQYNETYLNDKHNYIKLTFYTEEIYFLLQNDIIKDNQLKNYLINIYTEYEEFKHKYTPAEQKNIYVKYHNFYNAFEKIKNNYSTELDEITKFNELEKQLNINIYNYIFNDYLNKMKYEIKNINIEKCEDDEEKRKQKSLLYDEIKDITQEELNYLIKKRESNKGITYNNTFEIIKAIFKTYFKDPNKEEVKHIYNNIYSDKYKRQYFDNIILEFNYYNNPLKYTEYITKTFNNILTDQTEKSNIYNKLNIIIEINKIFKIKGSYSNFKIKVGTFLKKFHSYILNDTNKKLISNFFKLKYDDT